MRTLGLLLLVVGAVCFAPGCDPVKGDAPDAAPAGPDGSLADASATDAPATDGPVVDASGPPDAFACEPDHFECVGTIARRCNATGDAVDDTECGAPGCNMAAGRCNTCIPDNVTCATSTTLATCGANGLPAGTETCTGGCVATSGTTAAHCRHIDPTYLAGICDTPATADSLQFASDATLDSSADASCNGGVLTQTGGPPICVLRYGTFTISSGGSLKMSGTRVVAIVTDGDLNIDGTLDVSADGTTSGPGSATISGTKSGTNGGGGAGFAQAGAAGGSTTVDGAGGAGGATSDPLAVAILRGGPRSPTQTFGIGSNGGGGGGGATLVSCAGTVRVTGILDAGGGGGRPGADEIVGDPAIQFHGGAGGGAGGYIVLQGLNVNVSGRVFANGGGGGGGGANDSAGGAGGDGAASTNAAAGGIAAGGTTGTGGRGGTGSLAPTVGLHSASPGGGGGSCGHFQAYVPIGVTPTISPSVASPGFDTLLRVPTK